jgi:hypothetical protein
VRLRFMCVKPIKSPNTVEEVSAKATNKKNHFKNTVPSVGPSSRSCGGGGC